MTVRVGFRSSVLPHPSDLSARHSDNYRGTAFLSPSHPDGGGRNGPRRLVVSYILHVAARPPFFSRSALAPLAFFLLAIFLHPSQPESFFCCSFCVDHHHLLCLKSVPTLASSSLSRLLILPCFFSTSLHSQGFTHPNKPTVYSSDSPGGPWKPHPVCSGLPLAYPWDLSFNRYPLVLEEGVDA